MQTGMRASLLAGTAMNRPQNSQAGLHRDRSEVRPSAGGSRIVITNFRATGCDVGMRVKDAAVWVDGFEATGTRVAFDASGAATVVAKGVVHKP